MSILCYCIRMYVSHVWYCLALYNTVDLDYPALHYPEPRLSGMEILKKNPLKMGVSAAVTMDTRMLIFCACANVHIHCCLSIKWVD